MDSPSSWTVFIPMYFFRSLFTSDIICGEFGSLIIPTLLTEGSSKNSSANPFYVCKISGSDLIFDHSCSLVELQPFLEFWSFCCTQCFNSGRNCSNKLALSKHVLSISVACNFQPLCNFGHHWDFKGFLHPVPFCHFSQLARYGWSNFNTNQVFTVDLT